MANKPEFSIGVGVAVAALVGAVYVNATPTLTDIRAAPAGDTDVAAARKVAAWTSAGLVGAVSLIAKDPTVFILGGAAVVVFDWWIRHGNAVVPAVGKATAGAVAAAMPAVTQEQAPADYGYADDLAVVGY